MPAASTDPGRTVVGIVGYTPVVEAYPLGPRLMRALEARLAAVPSAEVQNMSWSPIHIVQQFEEAARPTRVVLVGVAAQCRQPGRVTAWRWTGGALPDAAVHDRVYEAVTGVVDLENTLMIGARFGIWPEEVFTVEVELPAETFGTMVIAETGGLAGAAMARAVGFGPANVVDGLARAAASLAAQGDVGEIEPREKSAGDLLPVASFLHSRAATDGRPQ